MSLRIILRAVLFVLLKFSAFCAVADSSGTGFFISQDGLVVTNFHVIKDADSIKVTRFNGVQSSAIVLVSDVANDLAILQVQDATKETYLPVRHSSSAALGADLLTIGFPLTSIQGIEPKVTSGILSSLSGLGDQPSHFQISVPIQPGNSGGPLIAKDGSVVGVVTSKLNALGVVKVTGDIPQNVNFAVKSSYLIELFSTRAVGSRVKPILTVGPSLSTEEIVRRSLNGVVLIYAKSAAAPKMATATAPTPVPSPPPPSSAEIATPSKGLDFGNVRFLINDGYLEVLSIDVRDVNSKTTLRVGDRVVSCFKSSSVYTGEPRVYSVGDFEKCRVHSNVKPKSDRFQYMFRVMRSGQEAIGSIAN